MAVGGNRVNLLNLFHRHGPRIWTENGVFHWSIENKRAPLSLPWGFVYPPGTVGAVDPQRQYSCHYRVGHYSKRLFVIVVPRTAEYTQILEPGGEWSALNTYGWSRDCPHFDDRGQPVPPFKRGDS